MTDPQLRAVHKFVQELVKKARIVDTKGGEQIAAVDIKIIAAEWHKVYKLLEHLDESED